MNADLFSRTENSYPNGYYIYKCRVCKGHFLGPKGKIVCSPCSKNTILSKINQKASEYIQKTGLSPIYLILGVKEKAELGEFWNEMLEIGLVRGSVSQEHESFCGLILTYSNAPSMLEVAR